MASTSASLSGPYFFLHSIYLIKSEGLNLAISSALRILKPD
jgi:hypothetical protein